MATGRIPGRPPTIADAGKAAGRFGWICRMLREYSGEPDIQHTPSFARRLAAHLPKELTPATVNRMETGAAKFDIGRVMAYEQTLGCVPGELLDVFVYLFRLEAAPGAQISWVDHGDGWFYDLLYRICHNEPVSSLDWLQFSMAARLPARSKIFDSARFAEDVFGRLIEDFSSSFERDERLLREALINLSPHSIPYIAERVDEDPLTLFNVVESLGFVQDRQAWAPLLRLCAKLDDGVQGQTLLETVRRWIPRDPGSFDDIRQTAPSLIPYCEHIIEDPTEAYTAREEAIAFLSAGRVAISPRLRKYMQDNRSEIRQLLVEPAAATKTEIIRAVHSYVGKHLASHGPHGRHGATGVPAGLSGMLTDAIFSKYRVQRLGFALALGPLQIASGLAHGAGLALLKDISNEDYGTQRAVLRLMTKIDHQAAHPYFSSFAHTKILDEGVRLTAAWALGTGSGPHDEMCLRALLPGAAVTTRRVIVLAAERRNFPKLLTELATDRSSVVSGEAARGIRRLPKAATP
ncbi:hypothetical protein [Nocardia asteroides]